MHVHVDRASSVHVELPGSEVKYGTHGGGTCSNVYCMYLGTCTCHVESLRYDV